MKRTLLAALAVGMLAVVPARTLSAQSDVRFGVGAGLLLPMGDYSDDAVWGDKLGFHFGAGASIGLGTAPVRIRAEGSYSQTSHDVDGNTKMFGGMASLVYPFETPGKVKPYVLAGVGVYNVKESLSDSSETGVGFGGGAGLMFDVGSARVFVEARYLTSKAFDVTFARLPITVGVSFGGKKTM